MAGAVGVWIELRDQTGKLWGEYDPLRQLLRFRTRRGTPAILFDLSDMRTDDDAGTSGIYLPESE